jgi:exopolysaccharide production protein ExoQ
MSASITRISEGLRIGPRSAALIAVLALLGVVAAAAMATRLDMALIALGGVGVAITAVLGFRWPLLPLAVFAALIPIEDVVVIEGLGTLSKVAGLVFAITYAAPRLGIVTLGAMPLAGWAYLAWAIVSLGWAINPEVGWEHVSTLLQLFLIALLVANFVAKKPEIVRPVLWAYSLSAAATALIGIQAYVAVGLASTRSSAFQDQDVAQFAAVLLPAFFFGLYEAINGRWRILGGAVTLITAAGIVVSGTRGAWVAIAVVLLLFILPGLTMRRRVASIAVILLVGAVLYQLPGIPELVAERSGNAVTTGGAGRTDIWSVGLRIIGSSPLTGVGFANFPVAFTSAAIRAAGLGRASLQLVGAGSHNVVIATLAELGVIGLLLLGLFLGPLVLRRGWGPDAAAVRASLAALLVAGLFLDVLSDRKQVWLVIGLAAGLAIVARAKQQSLTTELPTPAGSGRLQAPWRLRRGRLRAPPSACRRPSLHPR